MKLKIPELKRCCFCLPLRHSLVAWGYFKLTADAFLVTVLSFSLMQIVMMAKILGPDDDVLSMIFDAVFLPILALAVLIVDFVVTLMFVIGGLEKNVKLTEAFYFISIAMWIISLLVTGTSLLVVMQSLTDGSLAVFSFYFLNLVVQTYFLILLRSEIIKLKNIGESRPQNNAAEVNSTEKCEEILEGEETGREAV